MEFYFLIKSFYTLIIFVIFVYVYICKRQYKEVLVIGNQDYEKINLVWVKLIYEYDQFLLSRLKYNFFYYYDLIKILMIIDINIMIIIMQYYD